MIGNFEKAIPKHIDTLEKELGAKRREIWALEKPFNHECDCEYCTVDNEDPDEETQKLIAEVNATVDDIIETIKRLKRHAEIHHVKLPKIKPKNFSGGLIQ